MANVEDRPYAGTWKLNRRSVVKYTPDALVFLNGDTSLPGCPRCRGRVDIQRFVTSLSVEAGTEPTSHSASIQLSVPRVQGEQIFIDGYNILRAGLEVHIFMRGFFPVRGMFKHLADPQAGGNGQFRNPTDGDQLDLSKYATYPYYPVFHGVVTQVTYEYSDGFYTGSLQCASLLHFWQYVNITTGGSWMAQDSRPNNDPGRPTLYGHNFNNTHPFSIIYTLYRDVAGSAAGVDYALAEESNLSAASSEGGRQVFDQIALYWEQRFKTRIQTLRMYGTNGQLFNAAQQAWLGTADSRDGERLLPSPTYNDTETTRTETDPLSARQSIAKALGLQNAGVDFVYSPLLKQDDELFNLSVLDMFAFNQTIAEMGASNVWTSTYQTKMDIAQQVMEVTGYEFYQDVDGDLVFKPPFWNLDVSTNRYYRLEDSDIVNITFTEKEPTATYIIVKGIWIEGLKDAVADAPELNKRGLYIDYKLVAKFGWRPAASLEITYTVDPKVLFWIGVARLDALNVDTFSASCTIPIRPELRPGYPVYIPFCDSYYYISQLSHSFAFGGQCTTNLVLTCRRSKWHAPGFLEPAEEGQSAINKIRLDRPDLPPRPLEIFVNGVPRIVGFPNVVMALDPRQFNPNFSVVGIGIDYFDQFDANTSADLLFSWLQRDVSSLKAFEAVGIETLPDGTQIVGNPNQIQRFRLRYSDNPDRYIEFSLEDLVRAFSDYKAAYAGVEEAQTKVNSQKEVVSRASATDRAFNPSSGSAGGMARLPGLVRLDTLEGELQAELRDFTDELGGKKSLQFLALVFDALQPQSNKPIRRKVDGIAGSDVTLSYFETLSHLKGQYLADTAPGNYRYFSCSHPFPSQQGMPIIEWDDGERGTESTAQTGRRRTGGGRRLRGVVTTQYFPPEPDLFNTIGQALASLPGIDNWLDPTARDSETRKLYGLTNRRREMAEEQMDERLAQNLMDIGSAVNTIVNRILKRNDYQEAVRDGDGFVLGNPVLYSGFRPASEPADAEAYHSQGVALDVTFCNGGNSEAAARGVTAQHQQAIVAVREEVLKAFNEGLIKGMGFYVLDKSHGGTFVHMDRRDLEAAKAIQARRGGQLPPRTGSWTQGSPKPAGWKAFGNSVGLPYRPWGRPLQPPEDKLVLGQPPFPATEDSNEPPPLPAPLPVPQTRPSIKTRALSADTSRLVVQFRPTVTNHAGEVDLRAPETELGVGPCDQGLQIAIGPQRTPRVLTTDQIQSIAFVRHNAKKFASVVGTSQQTGRLSFNATQLEKQITEKLLQDVQNLEDVDQTFKDLFQGAYTQIKEDLKSVEIPTFEDGEEGPSTTIEVPEFPDALTVFPEAIPPSALALIEHEHGVFDFYSLSDFTLGQLASVPGYVASGAQRNNGQGGQRQALAGASNYANVITRAIETKFAEVQAGALNPPNGDKQDRLSQIQTAFNQAVSTAIGLDRVLEMINDFVVQEATPKEGKIEKPLHSPVFPVSDEKGYEHYGAYRYGRGLSVERGGTFEFIHSGQDPFKNVTAQNAEEFLRVFTLVKQGKVSGESGMFAAALRGVQEAKAKMVEFVLNQRQAPLSEDIASLPADAQTNGEAVVGAGDVVRKVGLSEREREDVEQSVLDLAQVITELGQTSRGQDTLRELLVANGDDPDVIHQDSFDITDTQFARNFVNFAANYGKSPVFKTVAANAAYKLADLTTHLLDRAGDACVCRGSYSDVLLAAYARKSFVAVDGIDQAQNKATAFGSEQIIKAADGHVQQQREYRGQIIRGEQPDAKAFGDAGGGAQSLAAGAPLPQDARVPSMQGRQTVSPQNPSTSADPNDLPTVGVGILPDVDDLPDPVVSEEE